MTFFPEYKKINDVYEIAVLIKELTIKNIADAINELLNNETEYQRLRQNCLIAREHFTWQKEEQKLIAFYKKMGWKDLGPRQDAPEVNFMEKILKL